MPMSDIAKLVGFYARFTPNYSRTGYLARRTQWPAFKPDFTGQYWVVTGASGGIGAAIVAGAAKAGATVLAVARSSAKLEAARGALSPEAAQRVSNRVCDLASVAAIDELLDALQKDGKHIDVLMNNVGVLFTRKSTSVPFFIQDILGACPLAVFAILFFFFREKMLTLLPG